MKYYFFIFFMAVISGLQAQQATTASLPYSEIPGYPEKYTAETVAARMIDGLGFRYYWATEGLTPKDLAFKPNEEARTTAETLDHIYNLCRVIANATDQKPNEDTGQETMSFKEKRAQTLFLIKRAADKLRTAGPGTLEASKVIFKREGNSSEYPFWNIINGPAADALWHVGQVVSFRRSSGNPLNPKVSVFNGKLRN